MTLTVRYAIDEYCERNISLTPILSNTSRTAKLINSSESRFKNIKKAINSGDKIEKGPLGEENELAHKTSVEDSPIVLPAHEEIELDDERTITTFISMRHCHSSTYSRSSKGTASMTLSASIPSLGCADLTSSNRTTVSAFIDSLSNLGNNSINDTGFLFNDDNPLSATAAIVEAASCSSLHMSNSSLHCSYHSIRGEHEQQRRRKTKEFNLEMMDSDSSSDQEEKSEEYPCHSGREQAKTKGGLNVFIPTTTCVRGPHDSFERILRERNVFGNCDSNSPKEIDLSGLNFDDEQANRTLRRSRSTDIDGIHFGGSRHSRRNKAQRRNSSSTSTSKTSTSSFQPPRSTKSLTVEHERMVEISQGLLVRLRSHNDTIDAIRQSSYVSCKCVACSVPFYSIHDSDYVLCPECVLVSPMKVAICDTSSIRHSASCGSLRTSKRNIATSRRGSVGTANASFNASRGGVSLGFSEQDLRRMEQEICIRRT